MRYEQIPRPQVEDHPHIRFLIESQNRRALDRTYHQNREKELAARTAEIKDAPPLIVHDFYCHECRKDFKGIAVKQVEVDWNNKAQYIAFYRTKCWRGHWCMRLITDKLKDGYWTRSPVVSRDRGKHHGDLLQPGETGFELLYGRKNQHRKQP